MTPRPRQPGFFLTDAMTGVVILVLTMAVVAGIVFQHRQSTDRLAAKHDATVRAESILAAIGRGPEAAAELRGALGEGVAVDVLDGEAPAAHAWVRVTARASVAGESASASLVGLGELAALRAAGIEVTP